MMINEALRLIRVFYDLKQTEAADRLGISQSYLSELERGAKVPTLDILQKYAKVFELPVSSIMYFAENIDGARPLKPARYVAGKIVALMQFLEQRSGRIGDG